MKRAQSLKFWLHRGGRHLENLKQESVSRKVEKTEMGKALDPTAVEPVASRYTHCAIAAPTEHSCAQYATWVSVTVFMLSVLPPVGAHHNTLSYAM